jgi:hypothetical protein
VNDVCTYLPLVQIKTPNVVRVSPVFQKYGRSSIDYYI